MPESFTHRNADVYVPLAAEARSCHARQSLPDDLREAQAGRHARARDRGDAGAGPGPRQGVRPQPRDRREVVPRGDRREHPRPAAGAARGRAVVLLIACANVANLLLRRAVRAGGRSGSGWRSAPGGGCRTAAHLRIAAARAGRRRARAPARHLDRPGVRRARGEHPAARGDDSGRRPRARLHRRHLGRASEFSAGSGLFCGCALTTLTTALREGDIRTASGARRFGNGLVVAETPLAFALLVGAGLMVKNLSCSSGATPGSGPITSSRSTSDARPDLDTRIPRLSRSSIASLYERLRRSVACRQSVLTSHLPMYRFGNNGEMTREGGNPWGANENPLVEYRYLHGDYLKALGIPLLRGRRSTRRDSQDTNGVLINQAMADKFWPGQDPIGRRFGQGQFTTIRQSGSCTRSSASLATSARSDSRARPRTSSTARPIRSRSSAMTVVIRSSAIDPHR